jgi:hypothetical protein
MVLIFFCLFLSSRSLTSRRVLFSSDSSLASHSSNCLRKGSIKLKADAAAAAYPNTKLDLANAGWLFRILITVRSRRECHGLIGYCAIAFPMGVRLFWLSSASNVLKQLSASIKLSLSGGVGNGKSATLIVSSFAP